MTDDPDADRRPSGRGVPPELVAGLVGAAMALLAAAIACGVLLLNAARPPQAAPPPPHRID